MNSLLEQEKIAIELMRAGSFVEAIERWLVLLSECPNWEHGTGQFYLGGCYEEIGNFDDALLAYQAALALEPHNPYFLGGLASFLYLHGSPQAAYDAHLRLLRAEEFSQDAITKMMPALLVLGERLGKSELEVRNDLSSAKN